MKSAGLCFLLSLLAVAEAGRFLQENERTRLFLRYKGLRGRRLARKCARSIIQDNDDDDVVIMEATHSSCLDQLTRLSDILEVDYDNEVQGMGMIDGHWQHSFSRALDEVTPWGIEMIQADQVPTGNHEVIICIVDAGLAAGHPDFNNENVNGTDTVKFYGDPWAWGKDGSGHGKFVRAETSRNRLHCV